jgi:hypothetical protein
MATDIKGSCGTGCVGFFVVGLFLLFLGLKLGEVGVVATWSWWWVTAPLWIYFGIVFVVFMFICAAFITVAGFGKLKD